MFRHHLCLKGLVLFLTIICHHAHGALFESNPANFGTVQAGPSDCDDCFSGPIAFPGSGQTITLFGVTHNSLFVGSNGYVTFGTGQDSYTPSPLDVQSVSPMIAGLYTDLDSRSDATSQVFVNDATPGQLIVTWFGMGHFSHDYSVRSTFQLVVRSDQFALLPGQGRIGFFYDAVTDPSDAAVGFGDGLPASNPGERAIYFGPGTGVAATAPQWVLLTAGGVPVVGADAVSVPTLSEWGLMTMVLLLLLSGQSVICQRIGQRA